MFRERRSAYRETQNVVQARRDAFVRDQVIRNNQIQWDRSRHGPPVRVNQTRPNTVHIRLRNSQPDIRSLPITTTYRLVSETTVPYRNMSWRDRERLRRLVFRIRNAAIRQSVGGRLVEFVTRLNNILNILNSGGDDVVVPAGWEVMEKCFGGPGGLENVASWFPGCTPNSYYQSVTANHPTSPVQYFSNVDYSDLHWLFGWPMIHQNIAIRRKEGNDQPWPGFSRGVRTAPMPFPSFGPAPLPPLWPNMRPIPRPYRNLVNFTVPEPVAPPAPPRPPIQTRGHSWSPPPRDTKETKVRVPAFLAKALGAAFAATEASDLFESLYDALPDHIRDATPRTGRTNRFARIGAGVPYVSVVDRIRAVFRHYRHINMTDAMINILYNHYEDYIVGTVSGTADRRRREAGGSGWGWVL